MIIYLKGEIRGDFIMWEKFKRLGYGENGEVKSWVYCVLFLIFVMWCVGGIYRFIVGTPPSDKIMNTQYSIVLGQNLTLKDSLLYASYGFTQNPTVAKMKDFKNIDIDWKKVDKKDVPERVLKQYGDLEKGTDIYEGDVDESLAKGVKSVKHYVFVTFTDGEGTHLDQAYTYIENKNGSEKLLSLEGAVNFTTAYLITRGK